MTLRALRAIADGTERNSLPQSAVLLRSPTASGPAIERPAMRPDAGFAAAVAWRSDRTRINGKLHRLAPRNSKSLLRLLREDAGLTGTKEGMRRRRVRRLHCLP